MNRVIEVSKLRPRHIDAVAADKISDFDLHYGYEMLGMIRNHLAADGDGFQTSAPGPIRNARMALLRPVSRKAMPA